MYIDLKSWGDFPDGPVAKSLHFQCRGPRFDLCSRNSIPHAATKILCAATKAWHSQINNFFLFEKEKTWYIHALEYYADVFLKKNKSSYVRI